MVLPYCDYSKEDLQKADNELNDGLWTQVVECLVRQWHSHVGEMAGEDF